MSRKETGILIFCISLIAVVTAIFSLRVAATRMEEERLKVIEERLAVIEEGKDSLRQEAVTVGVARWTADEKGKPKFEWIVPVEKKP
jgi:hypothetical protein